MVRKVVSRRGDDALEAQLYGWAVFRLVPGEKVPLKGTRGFLDATTHEAAVQALWELTPDANIGIATGQVSGIWVLDVDPRHGGDESLVALVATHGDLPETVTVHTGGGGRQFYFEWPEGLVIRNSAGRLGPGLDVRGEGGYVVGAGSLHPNGNSYRYAEGRGPEDGRPMPAPDWLAALVATPDEPRRPVTPAAEGGIPVGTRNETLFRFGCAMRARGASEGVILAALLAMNEHQCVEPLPEHEVRPIAHRAAAYAPARDISRSPDAPRGMGANGNISVLTLDELLSQPEEPIDWLIDGVIEDGGRVILSGTPGAGKTWALADLALSIASGRAWMRRIPVRQGTVLYLDQESGPKLLRRRLRGLAAERNLPLHIVTTSGLRLDDADGLEIIRRLIAEYAPTVVLADSFIRFHGADENKANEMARVTAALDRLRGEFGCAFVMVDHMRKPGAGGALVDRLRGSIEKQAWADAILSFTRTSQKPLRFDVEHSKARVDEPIETFSVELVVGAQTFELKADASTAAVVAPSVRERIVGLLNGQRDVGFTRDEVREHLGLDGKRPTQKEVNVALAALVTDEVVGERERPKDGPGRRAVEYVAHAEAVQS